MQEARLFQHCILNHPSIFFCFASAQKKKRADCKAISAVPFPFSSLFRLFYLSDFLLTYSLSAPQKILVSSVYDIDTSKYFVLTDKYMTRRQEKQPYICTVSISRKISLSLSLFFSLSVSPSLSQSTFKSMQMMYGYIFNFNNTFLQVPYK